MGDAMVTARMAAEKKREGNLVLQSLGTNASAVMNKLYDYLLAHRALPEGLAEPPADRKEHTPQEWACAFEWADSLLEPVRDDGFAAISLDEMRWERLQSRGLIPSDMPYPGNEPKHLTAV